MSYVTVEQLATQISKEAGEVSVSKLIQQLKGAGVSVTNATDMVSESDKQKLLAHLKLERGEDMAAPRQKISLRRVEKTTHDFRTADGRKSSVEVISRKKRTYVRAETTPPAEDATLAPAVAEDNLLATPTHIETPPVVEQTIVEEAPVLAASKVVESKAPVNIVETAAAEPKTPKTAAPAAPSSKPSAKKNVRKEEKTESKDVKKKGAFEDPKKQRKIKSVIDDMGDEVTSFRRRPKKFKKFNEDVQSQAFVKPSEPKIYEVKIPEAITVADLAKAMSVKAAEVIKVLMSLGAMATINQIIDQDTACLIVEEMGHTAIPIRDSSVEDALDIQYNHESLSRWPIVTVMGHVDHGKTSLLDRIRQTKVTQSEAGGITQHIGAYQVDTQRGKITFLDTPGHAAFTAMRARGANCTDIVLLVVAADDGVMPQTVEAIQHSKAAGVPIIVVINKIDKPDADPEKIINELAQYDLMPESWGGSTLFAKVSAKEGTGIDELLESIMLQSEVMELKAVYEGPAKGIVIEARIDRGRGPVATLLVQSGVLKAGDMILAGLEYGRVRIMINDQGRKIDTAGPCVPVEVLGLSGAPKAGDVFQMVVDESKAREIAFFRQAKHREIKLSKQQATKLEGFMERMKNSSVKVLNIVLKADVQGSIEALADSLEQLTNSEIAVKVISRGVGGFNESDINLAMASEAVLIGFNVRADATARKMAQREGIEINYYSIIYDVIDDLRRVLLGKLGPQMKEKIIGLAEVRDVFRSSKIGAIAGCMVIDGKIKRGNPIRVLRNNVVIYEGELESLRRFKEAVAEVRNGMECGIGVKNYNDVQPGDQIEVFEIVEVAREVL
jgi:translation initiation factor IF-2